MDEPKKQVTAEQTVHVIVTAIAELRGRADELVDDITKLGKQQILYGLALVKIVDALQAAGVLKERPQLDDKAN